MSQIQIEINDQDIQMVLEQVQADINEQGYEIQSGVNREGKIVLTADRKELDQLVFDDTFFEAFFPDMEPHEVANLITD